MCGRLLFGRDKQDCRDLPRARFVAKQKRVELRRQQRCSRAEAYCQIGSSIVALKQAGGKIGWTSNQIEIGGSQLCDTVRVLPTHIPIRPATGSKNSGHQHLPRSDNERCVIEPAIVQPTAHRRAIKQCDDRHTQKPIQQQDHCLSLRIRSTDLPVSSSIASFSTFEKTGL